MKTSTKEKLLKIKQTLLLTVEGFMEHETFTLAAGLAYYTVFSLAPILIIILTVAGAFMSPEAVRSYLFSELDGLLGPEAVESIQGVMLRLASIEPSIIAGVIGLGTLLFTATTIFASLQTSLNKIWHIRPQPKSNIIQWLKSRLLSFGMVLALAFVLLVSLVISAILQAFQEFLEANLPHLDLVITNILGMLMPILIIGVLFTLMFKVLPDAKIKWKDVSIGGFITAILFGLGKQGISYYVVSSDLTTTYGAAGSITVLMVWVYYSALIMYIGANFTYAYAQIYGGAIKPKAYAIKTHSQEIPE